MSKKLEDKIDSLAEELFEAESKIEVLVELLENLTQLYGRGLGGAQDPRDHAPYYEAMDYLRREGYE